MVLLLEQLLQLMIRIGYQGVENSNNHIAAEKFIESNEIENYTLIPLVSSDNVVRHLLNKEIDLGIMAISNSIIGLVQETKNAVEKKNLIEISRIKMSITHAAFKLNSDLSNFDVKYVASHEAALAQCKNNIKLKYPNAELTPIKNTGLGPQMLVNGELDPSTVIICPPKAGKKYDLVMDHENLSDMNDSATCFGIFKLAD